MRPWNDQGMALVHLPQIDEGQGRLIFMDNGCTRPPRNDFTEYADLGHKLSHEI